MAISPFPSIPLLRFKCALVPRGEREEMAPSPLVGEGWGEGERTTLAYDTSPPPQYASSEYSAQAATGKW